MYFRSNFDTAWDDGDDDGGEYVGGFGSSNGNNMASRRNKFTSMRTKSKKAPPSLLDMDTDRDWDNPDGGEFVGGGGDDSFVGGGDPSFLPAGGKGQFILYYKLYARTISVAILVYIVIYLLFTPSDKQQVVLLESLARLGSIPNLVVSGTRYHL